MEFCAIQENNLQKIILSLVIPVFNYEKDLKLNVDLVVTGLRKKKIAFELILVNDGSLDKTREEMIKLSSIYPEIKIIDYPKNRGKGYAVKQGVLIAEGKFIFFTDVDLPYGLEPIYQGMEILATDNIDMILGSRDLVESQDILSYDLKRKITKRGFSLIVNSLLRLDIKDTQCGLKGFKKVAAQDIFTQLTRNDFSFDVEVLYLARRKKFNIKLVPVHLKHSASSTVSVLRDPIKMLGSVLMIRLNIFFKKYDD